MIDDIHSTLVTYMSMVTALAVTANLVMAARQRKAGEKALGQIQSKVNATHVIVNAQKTAMMQKIANAQLIALTMAQALLEERPHSTKLQKAVAAAQALYDETLRDLAEKEAE